MSTTLWNGSHQISGSAESDLAAIKSNLTSNETQFKFGIDSDGNYGYYKAGADTVTPFKVSTNNEDYGIGELIFSFCGCEYNYCLLDVTNLNGLLYNQPKSSQGSSNTVFYAYDSWDTAISEGIHSSTGTAFATITQSTADTKQIWHYLDISNIKYIKIIEGYNWGLTQFSLPYSERTKIIEKIYIHCDTYTEGIYKYPTLRKNCLRFTAKAVNGSIMIDPGRYLSSMRLGYGKAFGSDTTKYITAVDQPLLIPEIGRDESGDSTSGCYCDFGSNKYGGGNRFDLLIEVIK